MNDMMIAALRRQREAKMDSAPNPASKTSEAGLEPRIAALEAKIEMLMKALNMVEGEDENEEADEQPSGKPGY